MATEKFRLMTDIRYEEGVADEKARNNKELSKAIDILRFNGVQDDIIEEAFSSYYEAVAN